MKTIIKCFYKENNNLIISFVFYDKKIYKLFFKKFKKKFDDLFYFEESEEI